MTHIDRLERDLTAWFEESAAPRRPDYTDAIVRETAGVRQRPGWTFPERWLPMSVIPLQRMSGTRLPWRTIGLIVVLALLAAAAIAVYAGSRPRRPAPFGPAGNGLVAFSSRGDVFTVDPTTGTRYTISSGPTVDHHPRFSLDGTRLAFLRDVGAGTAVVIADADGRNHIVATTQPLSAVDTDGIAWAPDGRSIAVSVNDGTQGSIVVLDAAGGGGRTLAVDYQYLEVYWRPPAGLQLMFLGRTSTTHGLFLVSPENGNVEEVPLPDGPTIPRLLGWTPDGRRFAYQRDADDPMHTRILDLATGTETIVEVAFGHLSNDGRRLVGVVGEGQQGGLCVALVDGGPCTPIGRASDLPVGTTHEALFWSPDDEWIIVHPQDGGSPVLIDPDTGAATQPSWLLDGAESWQRVVR